jgi:hypothetical protein
VLIQATAGDEAQLAIERRYFIQATSLYEPVVGASGLYDLYAVASYVPTSHATTVKPFDIVVATEPPTEFEYTRHLAQVAFDGLLVTDVLQNPHKLNAAQLDGHIASTEPSDGDVVPVGSSNGKLARKFRPIFPGVDTKLGEVIDVFIPPGLPVVAPPLFELCLGQTLGPSQQDVVPGGNLYIPTMIDNFIIGADPAKAHGAAAPAGSNNPADAPGVGGVRAAHGNAMSAHTHPLAEHSHPYPHSHLAPHAHIVASHAHDLNRSTLNYDRYTDPPFGQRKRFQTGHAGPQENYTPAGGAQAVERGNYTPYNAGVADTPGRDINWPVAYARGADVVEDDRSTGPDGHPTSMVTNVSSPSTGDLDPGTTNGTDSLAAGVAPAPEPRPLFHGMVRMMRVRD